MPNPTPRMRTAGSRGSRIQRYPIGTAAAKKKERGGALGFVENLGEDIAGTIVGLPAGVVQTVREPTKTAKAIGRSYAQTYGQGAGHFFHEFYEHPLGPILDLATIASLGAASAGTAGASLARAGTISQTSRLARLGQPGEISLRSPRALKQGEGPTAVRRTSRRPLRKAQQLATDRFLKVFDAEAPIVGEFARYGREMRKMPAQDSLRLKAGMTEYLRAMAKLKGPEKPALAMLFRGVSPEDYRRFLQQQANQDLPGPLMRALEDPDVSRLWRQPSERMLAAYERHAELADLDAQIKIGQGRITAETAATRPERWREIISERLGQLEEPPVRPVYIPDHAIRERVANVDFGKMGGGIGVPQAVGGVNRGVLLRTGQIALDPDLLGTEFLRDVKYGFFDDLHDSLLDAGARLERGSPIPKGWVPIRRKVREGRVVEEGPGQPEQLGYVQKTRGEHERALADLFEDDELRVILDRDLIARNVDDAALDNMGNIIVIPEQLARQVAGEFHRSSRAMRTLLEKPTTVWRALVLGARPGFLVNNVVGNNLLYALRFAGPAGIRAYLNMLAETKGPAAVRALLTSKDTPPGISKKFMAEFFPEQTAAGTFIGSQVPGQLQRVRGGTKLAKGYHALSLGLQIPDRAIEGALRRAAVEAGLRKTPRVREILRGLPAETRSFETAARKALDEDPLLQREISGQVNDALGNYLDLTKFERNAVRAVFPFYAWMRAITAITAKLPLEAPGRTDLLSKLGEIGLDMTKDELGELPSYLRGVLILDDEDGDRRRVLTTQGLNPFGTVEQVGRAGAALVAGELGTLGPAVSQLGPNPFVKALVEQLSGQRLWSGAPISGDEGLPLDLPARGLPALVLSDVAEQLPQLQLFRGPSDLYPERSFRSQLLAYMGAPAKTLDVSEAHRRARREAAR